MKRYLSCLLCFTILILTACTAESADLPVVVETPYVQMEDTPKPTPVKEVYLIDLAIQSNNFNDNLIGISSEKSLTIYLPPSYYKSDKSYPVVYYLHGYTQSQSSYIYTSFQSLDSCFLAGADEFIMVGLEGGNCFYVNSPVTGNWEDYIIEEAIPFIDENYRTIDDADSRGICGMSMGGFGAMNLAMRHPDVFCAFYAMGPGMLIEDDLSNAFSTWRTGSFLRDYARAFAPSKASEPYGIIPELDGTDEDNIIVDQWLNGFGKLNDKIDAYLALGKPLKGIGLCYGSSDYYTWIQRGTQYFSDALDAKGIDHTLYVFPGGHNPPPRSIEDHIVPFFNEHLSY